METTIYDELNIVYVSVIDGQLLSSDNLCYA